MNDWIIRLLPLILTAMSGPLRAELTKFAKDLQTAARATENPWDDFVADILCWLVGIK